MLNLRKSLSEIPLHNLTKSWGVVVGGASGVWWWVCQADLSKPLSYLISSTVKGISCLCYMLASTSVS